jgi:hypothetical protein
MDFGRDLDHQRSHPHHSVMPQDNVTQVSSAAFTANPQRYLDEAQAGNVVEISASLRGEGTLVLISKEELEAYRAVLMKSVAEDERQITAARKVMKRRRSALHELAKR